MRLNFDFRILQAGVGVAADSDLRLDLFEAGSGVVKETRAIGTDWNSQLIQSTDGQGIFYVTRVDVSGYVRGLVTGKWYAKVNGINILPYPTEQSIDYPSTRVVDGVDLRDYARAFLGYPAVDIELSESQYNAALTDTLDTYNKYLATPRRGELLVVPGQKDYFLPEVGDRGVYEVMFTRTDGYIYSNPFFGREFPNIQTLPHFDEYVYGISFLDSLKRTTSTEPEFEWDSYSNKLWIDLGPADGINDSYRVTYYWQEDTPLQRIPSQHRKWVKDFYLASCQEILGQIRSKYGGVVKAPGGDLNLNGQDLLQRAVTMKERLIEEIKSLQPPVPPIRG